MSGCACFLLQRRRCRSVPSDELSTDRQRFDDRLDDRPPMRERPLARILAVAPSPGNPACAVASVPMAAGAVYPVRCRAVTGSSGSRRDRESTLRGGTPAMRGEPVRYVALGDSYTIGTSVAASERWPNQRVQ